MCVKNNFSKFELIEILIGKIARKRNYRQIVEQLTRCEKVVETCNFNLIYFLIASTRCVDTFK